MSDLKKAGPPPIPHDALKKPTATMKDVLPSPFDHDVISSAPKPSKNAFGGANWLNNPEYPLVKPHHEEGLEQEAAIKEFGHGLPREQAEQEAYKSYKEGQHKEAAAYHLNGSKAANAVGDVEAARKHTVMYGLHAKALGHESIGTPHPDITSQMAKKPTQMKFKPHHGDQLVLDAPKPSDTASSDGKGIQSSAPGPMLGKREDLYTIYLACQELIKREQVTCRCSAFKFPHRHTSHTDCPEKPVDKESAVLDKGDMDPAKKLAYGEKKVESPDDGAKCEVSHNKNALRSVSCGKPAGVKVTQGAKSQWKPSTVTHYCDAHAAKLGHALTKADMDPKDKLVKPPSGKEAAKLLADPSPAAQLAVKASKNENKIEYPAAGEKMNRAHRPDCVRCAEAEAAQPISERPCRRCWAIPGGEICDHCDRRVNVSKDRYCDGQRRESVVGAVDAPDDAVKGLYLRYGDLPASGHSFNHRDGSAERGVSAYHVSTDGKHYNVLANDRTFEIFNSGRPAHLVSGTKIGHGSDGEPVLRDAKIVGKLRRHKAGWAV